MSVRIGNAECYREVRKIPYPVIVWAFSYTFSRVVFIAREEKGADRYKIEKDSIESHDLQIQLVTIIRKGNLFI